MSDIVERLREKRGVLDNRWPGPSAMDLEAAAEIERLRAALAPFAADKLPSPRRTEIAYNRWGLRCLMSPLEVARTAAYQALPPPQTQATEPVRPVVGGER